MTLAELERAIRSFKRTRDVKQQEIATQNYILACLTGTSIAAYFSEDITMPKIEEVYPNLFKEKADDTAKTKQDLKTELSVARFKQFADFHNKKFGEGVANISE